MFFFQEYIQMESKLFHINFSNGIVTLKQASLLYDTYIV